MKYNILLIVEGEKTENKFFNFLFQKFGMKANIIPFGTNIFTLYSKLKNLDFNADIKTILKEMHPEKNEILKLKFAYTYLVFDCDLHNLNKYQEENKKNIDLNKIVFQNFAKLERMASYFDNETDPAKGKLYLNYPMMESYKDCDNFFDKNYIGKTLNINDFKNYKNEVGKRKMAGFAYDALTKGNFCSLILQNLFQLGFIYNLNDKMPYEDYLQKNSLEILNVQKSYAKQNFKVYILNTSLFILIDYFGNQEGFYDFIYQS